MTEPAYVAIADEYARKIRGGELPPGIQLPSYAEIARDKGVSEIVVRRAVELLQRQGLVRTAERRGIFATDSPNLVRVSPDHQTGSTEALARGPRRIEYERETLTIPAPDDVANLLGVAPSTRITRVVTRASEGSRPVSIADTYMPPGVVDVSDAVALDETLADRLPTATHATWLRTAPGDLVKTVHQRFHASNGRVVAVSDVSYPLDRYDAFTFRMSLVQG